MRIPMIASALALALPGLATAATSTTSASAPAAATDMKAAVAAKIKADWPKYDTGGKGHLTREELAKWLSDLHVAAGQPAPDAEWQKQAFVQTDKNSDTTVSLDELTSFLTSGA